MSTGWTECFAIPNRAKTSVSDANKVLRTRLPFPLLGIDPDNGSDFINNHFFQYCLSEKITFSRSRAYKKNDKAYVEQKNGSVVRNTVGYDRFDTEDDLFLLQCIYKHLHVYVNFFQPIMKLIKKERINGKTLKVYDQSTSSYRRVLASDEIDFVCKIRLTNLSASLNPVQLWEKIDLNIGKLWEIV